jgi:hypothetical protein
MRPDMFKVIVERPRRGRRRKFPRGEKAYLANELRGMRRAHRSHKHLIETLAPLERFLGSHVGKHWSKVYAEICEHLRPDSAVQQHVRDHSEDLVALHTEKRENGIYVKPGRGWFRTGKLAETRFEFYVHPVCGVLMRNRQRSSCARRSSEERQHTAAVVALRRRDISKTVQLHKLTGCWFEVTLTPATPRGRDEPPAPGERDAIIDAGLSPLGRYELYGQPNVYASAKRQLSKRELAEPELRNDGQPRSFFHTFLLHVQNAGTKTSSS